MSAPPVPLSPREERIEAGRQQVDARIAEIDHLLGRHSAATPEDRRRAYYDFLTRNGVTSSAVEGYLDACIARAEFVRQFSLMGREQPYHLGVLLARLRGLHRDLRGAVTNGAAVPTVGALLPWAHLDWVSAPLDSEPSDALGVTAAGWLPHTRNGWLYWAAGFTVEEFVQHRPGPAQAATIAALRGWRWLPSLHDELDG